MAMFLKAFLITTVALRACVHTMSDEKLLLKRLTSEYKTAGKLGLPVLNTTQTVVVRFGLSLIQLEVIERQQILTLSTWARYVS